MTFVLNLSMMAVTIGLVVTSPTSVSKKDEKEAKRDSYSCFVNGRVYQHGEIFTLESSRCIKYRCAYGNYDFYEEGCESWGRCWPANQEFQYKCGSYKCFVTRIAGNYKHYQVKPSGQQLCQDYYGQCRMPGERFPYNMRGRVRSDCTCQTSGAAITYYCYS